MVLCRRDDTINTLDISKYAAQNWKVPTIETLVQATPGILEKFPDRIVIDKENIVRGYVRGKNPRCFLC